MASPFGAPSSAILRGEIGGTAIAFLPRHGAGHRIPPSAINYRANIDCLKRVGVTHLLSVNAVGSLREDLAPGTLVLVDQFVDRTTQRASSFFDGGVVAHVSLAHPVCPTFGEAIASAARDRGIGVTRGGCCVVIEGPQFSTVAESRMFQGWGCDLIGMTALPEARLAREAELCYAMLALVTDYDCWHPGHAAVSVAEVMTTMAQNADKARAIIQQLPAGLRSQSACPAGCAAALDHAIVTPPEARDPATVSRLEAVAGRVLRRGGPG